MSNVVKFLEALGGRAASSDEVGYVEGVARLDVTPEQRDALLRRDPVALGQALGARATVLAYIVSPDDEGGGKDDDSQPDGDGQEGPDHVEEQSVRAA